MPMDPPRPPIKRNRSPDHLSVSGSVPEAPQRKRRVGRAQRQTDVPKNLSRIQRKRERINSDASSKDTQKEHQHAATTNRSMLERIKQSTVATAVNVEGTSVDGEEPPSEVSYLDKLLEVVQERLNVDSQLKDLRQENALLRKQLEAQGKLLLQKTTENAELRRKLGEVPVSSVLIEEDPTPLGKQPELEPEAQAAKSQVDAHVESILSVIRQQLDVHIQQQLGLQTDSVMHALGERLNVEPQLNFYRHELKQAQDRMTTQSRMFEANAQEMIQCKKKIVDLERYIRTGDRINWPLLRKEYNKAVKLLRDEKKTLFKELQETLIPTAENAFLRARMKKWISRYFQGHRNKIEAVINDTHNKEQLALANKALANLGKPTYQHVDESALTYIETWQPTPTSSDASDEAHDAGSDDEVGEDDGCPIDV